MAYITYLIVPAWSDQAGQCRIVCRTHDGWESRPGLREYRDHPEIWLEAGLMNSRGELVCLNARPAHYHEIRDCQPLMAGTTFTFCLDNAGAPCATT